MHPCVAGKRTCFAKQYNILIEMKKDCGNMSTDKAYADPKSSFR